MGKDSADQDRSPTSTSRRMGVAIALAVLFGIVLVAANQTAWLTATVLDTDRFVATLEPLPRDDAVSLALANRVADRVIESFDVTELIAETLPEGLEFIAVPLTNGVRQVTAGVAEEIIRSDAFGAVWTAALTGSHRIALAYVGATDEGVLVEDDGVAVLDLTVVGAQISERLGDRGFDLLEGSDRDLTVELFELPDSGFIKTIVELMYAIRWIVFPLTIGLLLLAIGVATDRRRISVWIGGATVLAMLPSLVAVRMGRPALTQGIEDPIQRAGAEAAWEIVLQRFVWQTWVLLLIGVVVLFAAWIGGGSRSAASFRATLGVKGGSSQTGETTSSAMTAVALHGRLIEWGAVALFLGLLLFGPVQPLALIVGGLVLLAVFVAGIEHVAASVSEHEVDVAPVE